MPKRTKFNVRTDRLGKLARTLDGIVYDSVAERNYAAELAHKVKTRQIAGFQRQVSYDLRIGAKLICRHKVDFLVHDFKNYSVHEVKGYETDVWRIKRKLFEALYPEIPYVVIKPKRGKK